VTRWVKCCGVAVLLVVNGVFAAGCASHAAYKRVKVTKNTAEVAACTSLGPVAGQAPYDEGIKAPINQMREQVIKLGGDALLVTSQFIVKTGVAYRCAK
jgi:hypothetical protein